jgi:hypothetical protein
LSNKEELGVYNYVNFAIPMFSKMYQKRLITHKHSDYELLVDNLSRSDIYISKTYLETFTTDLQSASKQVVLSTVLLNTRVVEAFNKEIKNNNVERIVVTLAPHKIQGTRKKMQEKMIKELENLGITVLKRISMQQNFCVIDSKISWYGAI